MFGALKKAGKFVGKTTLQAGKEVGERAVNNVTFGLLAKADKPIGDITEFFEDLREWQLAMGEVLDEFADKDDVAELKEHVDKRFNALENHLAIFRNDMIRLIGLAKFKTIEEDE